MMKNMFSHLLISDYHKYMEIDDLVHLYQWLATKSGAFFFLNSFFGKMSASIHSHLQNLTIERFYVLKIIITASRMLFRSDICYFYLCSGILHKYSTI